MNTLTADELLAGSNLSYEVEVPGRLLSAAHQADGGKVRLRPLTVRDLQLITRAAKDNDALTSALMVQSALLEAMQEKQVTIGKESFRLEEPFLVLATQNPVEYEGTFPLPEAQLDRFLLTLSLGYPEVEDEKQILINLRKRHPIEAIEQAGLRGRGGRGRAIVYCSTRKTTERVAKALRGAGRRRKNSTWSTIPSSPLPEAVGQSKAAIFARSNCPSAARPRPRSSWARRSTMATSTA